MNRSRLLGLALAAFAASTQQAHADEHRILYIGDSHSAGTFGRTLDKILRTIPNSKVSTYAVCGSSPDWFFSGQAPYCGTYFHPAEGPLPSAAHTPLVKPLLDKLRPEFTIVALGANQLSGSREAAKKQVQHLVTEIHEHGSRCIWVGPPDEGFVSRNIQSKFYEMLQTLLAEADCPLIDSRKYTNYPASGGDHIHYDSLGPSGSAIAREWAKSVGTVIEEIVTPAADDPAHSGN